MLESEGYPNLGRKGEESEQPPAGGHADLSQLADHRLVNGIIGMILEYSGSDEAKKDSEAFVHRAYDIWWFGNKDSNNTNFLDIFNKLVEIETRRQGSSKGAELALVKRLVWRVNVLSITKWFEENNDEFIEYLKNGLSGQIEHFGVRKGKIYAMRAYIGDEKDNRIRYNIIHHAKLERSIHSAIIKRLPGANYQERLKRYLEWRSGRTTEDVNLDLTYRFKDGEMKISIHQNDMSYNEFLQAAHDYAKKYFPLAEKSASLNKKKIGGIGIAEELPTAATAGKGESISIEDAIKALPEEYTDTSRRVDRDTLIAMLTAAGFKGFNLTDDSVLIFTEKATFGSEGFEYGLGVLLPRLAKSRIRIIVIATTDEKRQIVGELNHGNISTERISCASSLEDAMKKAGNLTKYYFRVAEEQPPEGVIDFDVTKKMEEINGAFGAACGVPPDKIQKLEEAEKLFRRCA